MDKKAFSLVEIIVSISIFVMFSTGYVFFLTQENVAEDTERGLALSSGLITEAQETIRNKGILYFSSGSWSLYTLSGSAVFFSGASVWSGSYVDALWNNAPQTGSTTFRRMIMISTGSMTYTSSTAKNISIPFLSVSIKVWYPWCNFSGNACVYRNFLTY